MRDSSNEVALDPESSRGKINNKGSKLNKNLVKWQLHFYSFITSLFLRHNSCFLRHVNAIQEHTDVFVLNGGRLLNQSSCEKRNVS